MRQLAKEPWEKDERRRKEIKEMGKLVEMHMCYNVENEETRSTVKKTLSSKETAKILQYPESCWDVLGYRKTASGGERVVVEREGNHRCLWGKQKGCTASWKTKATVLKKNTPTMASQCLGSDKKGSNCETESEQRNLSTTAKAKKIEWNLISLVQIPNPTQVQKLFEIL